MHVPALSRSCRSTPPRRRGVCSPQGAGPARGGVTGCVLVTGDRRGGRSPPRPAPGTPRTGPDTRDRPQTQRPARTPWAPGDLGRRRPPASENSKAGAAMAPSDVRHLGLRRSGCGRTNQPPRSPLAAARSRQRRTGCPSSKITKADVITIYDPAAGTAIPTCAGPRVGTGRTTGRHDCRPRGHRIDRKPARPNAHPSDRPRRNLKRSEASTRTSGPKRFRRSLHGGRPVSPTE